MKTKNLIDTLTSDAPPVKHVVPGKLLLVWLAAASLLMGGLVAALGVRPDIITRLHDISFVVELSLVLAITISAGIAACWLALPDVNQQQWLRWLPFVPFVALSFLLLNNYFSAHGMDPMGAVYTEYLEKRYDCAADIVLFSIMPGVVLFFIMRKAAPVHYFWAGGIAALAITNLGYFALRIVEVNDNIAHLLLWHYLPMAMFSLLGAFLGKMTLRW